jgi:hypothetical protein
MCQTNRRCIKIINFFPLFVSYKRNEKCKYIYVQGIVFQFGEVATWTMCFSIRGFWNAKNIGQQNFSLIFILVLHKVAQNFLSCWAASKILILSNQKQKNPIREIGLIQ